MLPVKPSVTTTSTVPLPMSSPSMKPAYSSGRPSSRRQPAGLLHLLDALDLLDADIEQADGRALDAQQAARHRLAHERELDELLGIGADRRADIEHDAFAAQRRPDRGDRRTR